MNIDIKGTICRNDDKWVYDLFGMDSCAPKDILQGLEAANGEAVDIYINSGGGSVSAGQEIYSAIAGYKGRVLIHVVGMAASAASMIMCAAESEIEPVATVMIHNVNAYVDGYYNYLDMERDADMLRTNSRALCQAYVAKTGRPEAEIMALMDQEKWFTAAEAVEMGLVDRVTDHGRPQLVAALAPVIPAAVADKMRDLLAHEREMGAASARLQILEDKSNGF